MRSEFDLEVWRYVDRDDPENSSVVLRKVKDGRGYGWIILERSQLDELLRLINGMIGAED